MIRLISILNNSFFLNAREIEIESYDDDELGFNNASTNGRLLRQNGILTLKLLIVTIVILEVYANSKTCPTYNTPDATIQTKYFHTNTLLFIRSKVLDFTHANKDQEYRISSC